MLNVNIPLNKEEDLLRAALEVFSSCNYGEASLEAIGKKAGISKDQLLDYFKNKKTLYRYSYGKALEKILPLVEDQGQGAKQDFFKLLEEVSLKKLRILKDQPLVYNFLLRGLYLEEDGEIRAENFRETPFRELGLDLFETVDTSGFRPGIEALEIYETLTWTLEGYINYLRRQNQPIVLEEIMDKYRSWVDLIKPGVLG